MGMLRYRTCVGLWCLAGAIILAAQASSGSALAQTTKKGPPAKFTIMVGISPGAPQVSIYWIGKPLGFFDEENIDAHVEVAPNSNMAQGTQMVIGGQADAVLTSIEAVLLPFTQNKDPGLQFVYSFYTKPTYRISVLPDSPIKTAADLKGKLLGLSHTGNPVEPMLNAYLAEFGVTRDSVRTQVIGNTLPAAEALKNKQVDASMQVSMSVAGWREAGYQARYLPEPKQFEKIIGASVAVKRSALADPERRSVIVRFLRAWAKSAAFVKANPEAAVALDYMQFPQAKPRGVADAEALRRGVNAQDAVMDSYTEKVEGRWGGFKEDTFRDYVEFLGLGANLPDPKPLWTNELIAEINNFDEAAIIQMAKNFKIENLKR